MVAFLGAVLDATKVDITAAHMAKAEGQRRDVAVTRAAVRLTNEGLAELHRMLNDVRERFAAPEFADPEAQGTWVRVLVAVVDLEERPPDEG